MVGLEPRRSRMDTNEFLIGEAGGEPGERISGQGLWGVREGGLGEPQIFGMDADAAEW